MHRLRLRPRHRLRRARGATLPLDFPARYELALERARRCAAERAAVQARRRERRQRLVGSQSTSSAFPPTGRPLRVRQRQIEFAWGPTPTARCGAPRRVEFVIASGSGAARAASASTGSRCASCRRARRRRRRRRRRPRAAGSRRANAVDGRPRPTGSLPSARCGGGADGRLRRAARVRRARAALARGAAASRYAIELSDDGEHWRDVRRVDRARGDAAVALAARFRSALRAHQRRRAARQGRGARRARAARSLSTPTPSSPRSRSEAPRGRYPRAYSGEQTYWTVLGVDGGRTASLLSEDGVLEPRARRRRARALPVVDGKVLSWADARISHTLRDGDLPMPSVHWRSRRSRARHRRVRRRHARCGAGARALPRRATSGNAARRVTLALAWRPFQANPPTQFLAHPGGASAIDAIWTGTAARSRSNGAREAAPLVAPSAVRLEPLAAGPVGDWLREPRPSPAPAHVADPAGFASAALLYDLTLAPGEQREIGSRCRVDGAPAAPAPTEHRARPRRVRSRIGASAWTACASAGPAEVEDVARTLRTALGHILVNRSGAGAAAGRARLCALLDPRRRADLVGAAAPRPRRRRARVPALVRAVPVPERQGAVLRDRARRRPGARERQPRRVRLRGRRPLALHPRRRVGCAPCGRTCARAVEHMEALRRSERDRREPAARARAPTSA